MNAKSIRAAVILILGLAQAAAAQQLVAWPIGRAPWTGILPGAPVRPLPPIDRRIPAPPREVSPVTLSGYSVEGDIHDQAAELTYRITYHNPTAQRLEGVLLVPIPADAVLGNFTMTVGGKEMKGELLEANQARTIYEGIVRRQQDPGLLELVGERLFRARVFPIEPNSDISVRLTMSQILRKNGGLAAVTVPVRSAQMTNSRLGSGTPSVRLKLKTTRPLRTVYSPTPGMSIKRDGERAAEAVFTGSEADAALYFSTHDDPLAAGILAHRQSGEDGFFMATLSPRSTEDGPSLPKDVVFVVDRSGSMGAEKMEQARQALSYCVKRLSSKDRFGIVDFATDWNAFEETLVPATDDNKARAQRYIERIDAGGGTNIEAGLGEGLRLLSRSEGRLTMLFFMTDGLPTVGQTDMTALLRQAQDKNRDLQARLFTFGVGTDVNTLFLDKLNQTNRGAGDYVQPREDIEGKVSTLYQKVANPALTDVTLTWEGVDAVQTYPRRAHDLFHGSDLVVLGRYKAGAKGKLIVTGKNGTKTARFEFPVEMPNVSEQHAFLPRLWANARVSSELDAIRLNGGAADPEVVNDIVRLAKRYGIVTPYTSYLVLEEGMDLERQRRSTISAVRGAAQDAAASGFGGPGSFDRSLRAQAFSMNAAKALIAPAAAPMESLRKEAFAEAKGRGERTTQMKEAGGKTFYLRGGVWTDGAFEEGSRAKVVEVRAMSEEYFELLGRIPALSRFFSVGSPLTVVHDGVVYKVAQ